MNEEESTETLLQKQKKEARKIKAARQRTNARFEALLNVGSGSEEISESTPIPRRSKKKERTKTTDSVPLKLKMSPNLQKRQSRSQEDLLQEDSFINDTLTEKRKSKTRKAQSTKGKTREGKAKKKDIPDLDLEADGTENDGFENSFSNVSADDRSVSQKAPNRGKEKDPTSPELSTAAENSESTKERKKKKRKPKISTSDRILKVLGKKYKDESLLLCILIHRCDQLKPDSRIHHPVVRIHIVDMGTGQYIKKKDKTRNVTSLSEHENIDYILPMMTQPFDFRKNRCLVPHWEETVLYNEVYSYFLQREQEDPKVIVFFEVLDFMQMHIKNKEFQKTDKGWHRIAWAFLKLVSPTTNVTNTDKKIRLQLYQPIARLRVQQDENAGIEIYQWWMYGSRQKYNSTLYVTVKGVSPPRELNPAMRSTFPTQMERGGMTFEELNSTLEVTKDQSDHEIPQHIWTKIPGQLNRIPNKIEITLPSGRQGCSVVRFSNDGRYVACACVTSDKYLVTVYEFPVTKLVCSFNNHFGIVYDLTWSNNNRELLSTSADSAVRCWDTKRFSSAAIKLFPHPSFVYTCKYHPTQQHLVITGSYDCSIRIWNKMSEGMNAELLKELNQHTGYINTLAFSLDGSCMFSGDSEGVIIEWTTPVEKKKKSKLTDQVNRWMVSNKIELDELKRISINTLKLHPGQNKLLIQTKDSMLRMFDLRSNGILKHYTGGLNFKEHIHAAMSPCGSFIFCGTENSLVHVWNTETGELLYTYKELGYVRPVSDIDFHPHDNYVAFCCYGDGNPIYIYSYDPELKQTQIRETTPLGERTMESQRRLDETAEMFKSLKAASLVTNDARRMEAAQEKLDSVLSPSISPYPLPRSPDEFTSTRTRVTFKDPSPRSQQQSPRETFEDKLMTRGSDFSHAGDSVTSPQSRNYLSSPSGHHHDSSSVRASPGSQSVSKKDNTLTLSQLEDTKNRMSFQYDVSEDESKREAPRKKVIALYDYQPEQADELQIKANDIITVLNEENGGWCIGKLQDGRQGYFPVNFVKTQGEHGSTSSRKKVQGETKHTAVVDKYGDLKILSEESDTNESSKRRRRKERKPTDQDRTT